MPAVSNEAIGQWKNPRNILFWTHFAKKSMQIPSVFVWNKTELQTVGQALKGNFFTGIFKDFPEKFNKFIWYFKKVYLAELFVVAAPAVNKKLSRVKYCSKGHLVRYHNVYFNNLQNKQVIYIYQLVSGEFPFAVTCSVEE